MDGGRVDWLGVEEAAERLGVGPSQVRRLARDGELPARRVGSTWLIDDTGIVKDGKHSPGVKRQYSGTLGKIGNCQVAVSVHAVGERGTLPLGFALYLPEEWCVDLARRRKAKIPDRVVFQTKPQLAASLAERAAGWELPAAPILADCAYGDDTAFRTGLQRLGREYVLAVSAQIVLLNWAAPDSCMGPSTWFSSHWSAMAAGMKFPTIASISRRSLREAPPKFPAAYVQPSMS